MGMNPRLLRPTPTGFDPRRIAGLVAWWDAQVASSYTIATGVSEWRDLSGNGHTLTQAIGNNQPALSTMNSRTAFLFDGSNDSLAASSVVLNTTSAGAFSFFGVTQIANGETGYIIHNGGVSGGTGIYADSASAGAVNRYDVRYVNGQALISPSNRSNDIPQVWGIAHSNQSAEWSLNGVLAAPVSTALTFASPTENLTVGNRPGGAATATYLAGRVGTLLIYSRALSATERQRLERWLGTRWGVTVA